MIQLYFKVLYDDLSFIMKSFRVIQEMHPDNNKQSIQLGSPVIPKTKTALVKNYIPNRLDGNNILSLFSKVFGIFNAEQCFNSSNRLRNEAVQGDRKP